MPSHSAFGRVLQIAIDVSATPKQTFARAIGTTPSMLSRYLAGRAHPSLELCLRIAFVSGMPVFQLLRAARLRKEADVLCALFKDAPKVRFTAREAHLILALREQPNIARAVDVIARMAAGDTRTSAQARGISRRRGSRPRR